MGSLCSQIRRQSRPRRHEGRFPSQILYLVVHCLSVGIRRDLIHSVSYFFLRSIFSRRSSPPKPPPPLEPNPPPPLPPGAPKFAPVPRPLGAPRNDILSDCWWFARVEKIREAQKNTPVRFPLLVYLYDWFIPPRPAPHRTCNHEQNGYSNTLSTQL